MAFARIAGLPSARSWAGVPGSTRRDSSGRAEPRPGNVPPPIRPRPAGRPRRRRGCEEPIRGMGLQRGFDRAAGSVEIAALDRPRNLLRRCLAGARLLPGGRRGHARRGRAREPDRGLSASRRAARSLSPRLLPASLAQPLEGLYGLVGLRRVSLPPVDSRQCVVGLGVGRVGRSSFAAP